MSSESQGLVVAVVDGRTDGHHTTYLRLVTRMLLDLEVWVLLLCPEPAAIESWLAAQNPGGDLAGRLVSEPFELPQPRRPPRTRLAGLAAYLRRWRAVSRAIQRHEGFAGAPRLVFFLWLDDFLSSARYISILSPLLLPLAFRHPWAGFFFRPNQLRLPPETSSTQAHRHPYSALRLASCQRVFIHDETRLAALGHGREAGKARRFPDFTDEATPAADYALIEEIRARARGRPVVAALGSMSRRKGILTLLEVALASPDPPWFFVFAGELVEQHLSSSEVDRFLELEEKPPDNCYFSFEYIPDEPSFNALVAASDALFAAYLDFRHSSNILTKAALFRKPVIVSRGHLMARSTRRFNLGACITQDRPEQCAEALRLLRDPSRFRREVGEPRFDDYLRRNSLASFRNELVELVDEL